MRTALLLAIVAGIAACGGGCADGCAGEREADCDQHRLPGDDATVMWLDPTAPSAEPTARPAVGCAELGCLRAAGDVVTVAQPDGAVWAAWAGDAGRIVSDPEGRAVAEAPEAVAAFVSAVRDRRSPGNVPGTADLQPPSLPPGLRTCGMTNAGGGVGFHVIQNDGTVWRRVHWARPPTSPDVTALPADAYPIAFGAEGALCAWARQRAPRQWDVHTPSGAVVAATPDREHPAAHCESADVVAVDAGDHVARVARDGTRTHQALPPTAAGRTGAPSTLAALDPVVPLAGGAVSTTPRGTLRIAGTPFAHNLDAASDLAGNPLRAGAVRARLASVGDAVHTVLVTERIEVAADCSTRELVHVIDVATGTVKTVRDADVIVSKLTWAAGRYWWLEATPQIVSVRR